MFQTANRSRQAPSTHLDVTSLIDVVFILLLFFLVTTTFVRDSGVSVNRPQAVKTQSIASTAMRITLLPSGAMFTDGRQVDHAELSRLVRQHAAREPEANVVLVTDESVPAGKLVSVMDTAKLAGARNIALATRQKGAP